MQYRFKVSVDLSLLLS